jgi:hypothetical protein
MEYDIGLYYRRLLIISWGKFCFHAQTYITTPKMETVRSSETSVESYQDHTASFFGRKSFQPHWPWG